MKTSFRRAFAAHFLLLLGFVVSTSHALEIPPITVTPSAAPLAANAKSVVINGSGFSAQLFTAVTLNDGAVGTITSITDTQLIVTFTSLPAPGNLTAVVTGSGQSSGPPVQVATVQPPVAQFYVANQSALASDGTFSLTVNLSAAAQTLAASGMNSPTSIVYDLSGNLYAADFGNNVVYKVTPDGTMSVFASGLSGPWGLALDTAGNLYVSNVSANTVSMITPAGAVSTFASGFSSPEGLAFDTAGNLYVANARPAGGTVSKVTPSGVVSTFASGFTTPNGLAFDSAGNLYVANSTYAGSISKVTPGGAVSTFISGLSYPAGLVFDDTGNLYVGDTANYVGGVPDIRKATPSGQVTIVASAGLRFPSGLAFDPSGTLYISDEAHGSVAKLFGAASVPLTIGGSAVAGVDYDNVTVGPLSFNLGQATATITGILLSNPAATAAPRTLSFTLGTPTGTTLGNTITDTITILQPPIVQFPAAGESVNASIGAFNVPATLIGQPTFAAGAAFTSSAFGSGIGSVGGMGCDAAGNLYVANGTDGTICKVNPGGATSVIASGFTYPFCFNTDPAGNCYVVTAASLEKISPTGQVVATLATDIDRSFGLVCDNSGNVYYNCIIGGQWSIVKCPPGGPNSTFASGFSSFLIGMAFGPDGCLYCGDQEGKIYKVAGDGTFTTFATVANFASGLAFDATGRLYVLDAGSNILSVITPDGTVTQALSGLSNTYALAADASGNLYIGGGNGVSKYSPTVSVPFTLSGTAAAGMDYLSSTTSPLTFVNGRAAAYVSGTLLLNPGSAKTLITTLGAPIGALLGNTATNTLNITEPGSAASVQFSTASENINQTAGTFSIALTLTGTPAPTFAGGASPTASTLATGFNHPTSVALDQSGNAYVANNGDGTVRKVTPEGTISTFASGFGTINGLAFDATGNLYVADGNTTNISRITSDGSVATFATGLNFPTGLAFDAAGNLYVATYGNNSVSKITPGGVVTPFSSAFNGPQGLAVDIAGNLYVANSLGGSVSVVSPSGVASTFATGFTSPYALAFDAGGNLYVADTGANAVNRITPDGVMTTLTSALISPQGLGFDNTGNLFIVASGNLDKLIPSVTVSYALGGSGVSGVDYSNVTAGTVVFAPGQTSATITGTVLADPGTNQTLTFTLSSPIGAASGSTTTNTLSVVEPPPSVTASTTALPINADSIVIQGIFNHDVASSSVTFNNGAIGTVTAASTSSLTVALTTPPTNVGPLMATVTSAGQTTAPTQVATVIPVVTPTISILNLASTTVSINGLGFDPTATNNTVIFNQGATGTVIAATSTQLTVSLSAPPSSTGILAAVVTTDGLSSGSPVTVAAIAPTVQFNPTSETINATTGTFNVTATLTGNASFAAGADGTSFNLASGLGLVITRVVTDAAGNIYALAGGALQKVTPSGTVTTVASSGGFNNPTGLAIDSDGNIYVSNNYSFTNTHNVIKFTPDGGSSFFIPDNAGLTQPTALVCDSAKNLYVGQGDGSIVKVTPAGVMTPFATCPLPVQAMAVDSTNNLYVSCADATMRKMTPAGVVSSFTTGFGSVFSLAFDSAGYLYVATMIDSNRWAISQVAPDGTVAGNIPLNFGVTPTGLAFDPSGNLYFGNGTTMVRLSPTVTVPFTLGGTAQSGIDYTGVTSPLTIVNGQTGAITGTLLLNPPTSQTLTFTMGAPTGASLGSANVNTMTIVEPSNAAAVQFTTDHETVNQSLGSISIPVTLTGTPTPSFANGAPGSISTFASNVSNSASASWITRDSAGNFYVSNYNIGDVSKISSGGLVTKFFLQTGAGYFRKEGMVFDNSGNLYVATHDDNGTGSVLKVTPGMVVATYASGFNTPRGLAFDSAGNLFVSCGDNTVQKITPAGVVSIFASGFSTPMGLAFDPSGNLYVANEIGNTVSKVTPAGVVNTFATGFNKPYGIVTDSAGNLYVTNNGGSTINRVTPTAVVSQLSGAFQPTGITFDSLGNLYVTSYGGNSVAELTPCASVQYAVSGTAQPIKDYSGIAPTGGTLLFQPGQMTSLISVTLPTDPGGSQTLILTLNTPLGVSLGTTKSNTMTIVEPAPTITRSTASLPINATQITISGLFNKTVANNTVTFNNGAVGTVVAPGGGGIIIIGGSNSVTSLTVNLTTPPNQVGPLLATVSAGGSSSTQVQVATVVPVVTSTTADIGLNATTLTINGFGFDPNPANNMVTLNNGATGIVTAASSTQLTIALSHAPNQTGALKAIVTTDGVAGAAPIPVGTVEPLAQFTTDSETVDASVSTFSIPVTLTGNPTFDSGVSPTVSTFVTGITYGQGLAFDAAGNLYVARNGDLVTKVTPDGESSTFASNFPVGQLYTSAIPYGLAFDTSDNLYVALAGTGAVVKVTPAGVMTTFVSGLSFPEGLAFDAAGNLFIADDANSTVIKATPDGTTSTFQSLLQDANSAAIDPQGNLYVGYPNNVGPGEITKITPDGSASTFLGGFNGINPTGLAFDNAGNLYASINNGTLQRITPEGAVSQFVADLGTPEGLAFDAAGSLYVADYGYGNIDKVAATALVPFAVGGTAIGDVDYTGLTAGPLVFVNGQPTVYITGTLIHHPGTARTLTFTLGTPSGAVLGTTTTNTLTILNAPVVTSSTANLANDSATLTINGFNFDPSATNDTVTFNDGTVGTVTAASATQLTVQLSQLPSDLGVLTAVVNTDGQDSGTPVQIAYVVPFANPTGITISGGTVTLSFAAAPNATYQLQYTPSLNPTSWANVGPVTSNGAGTVQYVGTPSAGTQGYYRLTH